MSHERSDQVWHAYRQSADKFDYFMAGLCSALTGYVVQGFRPGPIGLNAGTVELLAVLCLIASVLAALKRIESSITTMAAMHAGLFHGESAGALMEASQKATVGLNVATGDLVHPLEAHRKAERHRNRSQAADKTTDRWAAKAKRCYLWRNRFLVLGFCLLVLARILAAYGY